MQLNYLELTVNIVIASFGGLVRRLSEFERKKLKRANFSYYLIGSLISMFAGTIVFLVCKQFNVSESLTLSVTAISGYIGAPVLDMLSDIFKRRVQKTDADGA